MVAVAATALAQNPAATVNVNANGNRHAINPLIYGANWADQAMITDLNVPLNRYGGNPATTYNWQINAGNRGNDWYFESMTAARFAGDAATTFINNTKAAGTESMITIPMANWVAKLGSNR